MTRGGYVDAHGSLAIPARYHSAGCFSEGLAVVRRLDEAGRPPAPPYGYIDRRGAWAIPPRAAWPDIPAASARCSASAPTAPSTRWC